MSLTPLDLVLSGERVQDKWSSGIFIVRAPNKDHCENLNSFCYFCTSNKERDKCVFSFDIYIYKKDICISLKTCKFCKQTSENLQVCL